MNAESIDLDSIDDCPSGPAGPGPNIPSMPPPATTRKLNYTKKTANGSVEELDMDDDDSVLEPATIDTNCTEATSALRHGQLARPLPHSVTCSTGSQNGHKLKSSDSLEVAPC